MDIIIWFKDLKERSFKILNIIKDKMSFLLVISGLMIIITILDSIVSIIRNDFMGLAGWVCCCMWVLSYIILTIRYETKYKLFTKVKNKDGKEGLIYGIIETPSAKVYIVKFLDEKIESLTKEDLLIIKKFGG